MYVIAAAVIAGGAAVYSANKSANAAEKAAKKTAKASEKAQDTTLTMYNQSRSDLAPWRLAGENALKTLTTKVNSGPGKYTASPEYKIQITEGEKAINRAAASRGQYDSGKALKALTTFNQDEALKDRQTWLDNWYQSLNPLMTLSNTGQSSAAGQANTALKTGSALSDITTTGATTSNNYLQNAAAARASGYKDAANAIVSGVDTYQSNKTYEDLIRQINLNKQSSGLAG